MKFAMSTDFAIFNDAKTGELQRLTEVRSSCATRLGTSEVSAGASNDLVSYIASSDRRSAPVLL
jgi:hypothetical protein